MPRGDGTGPAGLGPMTGRRLGYCAGYNQPGFMTSGFGWGRGWGRGFGRGLGWRRAWTLGWRYPGWGYMSQYLNQPLTNSEEKELIKREKEVLTEELKILKEEMRAVEKRIKELEGKKK